MLQSLPIFYFIILSFIFMRRYCIYYRTMMKIVIVVLLLQLSLGRQISLPLQKPNQELNIRLGSLLQVRQPQFNFTHIQTRQVQQSTHNVNRPFPPCSQQAPEITFNTTDSLSFKDAPPSPWFIWQFSSIRYSQYVLDMLLTGDVVYVMFGDAHVLVFDIDGKKGIVADREYWIDGVDGRLDMGYFVEFASRVLFVNGEYVMEVREDGVQLLEGYQPEQGFQTAIKVEENLGVVYAEAGVKMYVLSSNTLTLTQHITASELQINNPVLLTDMLYKAGTLYILDKESGLLAINTNSAIVDAKNVLKTPYCSIMYIQQQTMYLVCEKVIKLNLQSMEQTVMSTTNLNVGQIYGDKDVVGLVGRNVLEVFYLGRSVAMYEDIRMEKVLFKDRLFVGINQHGVKIGNYKVQQPYIACSTTDDIYLGFHTLLFRTTAQCNQKYFEQNSLDWEQFNIHDDDTCAYSVQMRINLWEAGEVFNYPLLMFLIVWLLVTVLVFVCYLVKMCKLRMMNKELQEYQKLAPVTEVHSEIVQEASKQSYGKQEIEEVNQLPEMREQTDDIQ